VGLVWAGVVSAQQSTFIMKGSQLPVPVAVNGYVQDVTEGTEGEVVVRVATSLSPVGAQGSYSALKDARLPEVPAGFTVPAALAAELRPQLSSWDAATIVLEWVLVNVTLDVADRGPQDASTVLRRLRGRCSGLANVTAALLLASGFEARTVSGLLMSDEGPIPHRWVECRLPGAGWVPTDPTLGFWAITPHHVAFATPVDQPPHIEIVKMGESLLAQLPRRRGLPLRPNLGSELVCRLAEPLSAGEAVAELHGAGGEVRRGILDPECRFSGLIPGTWLLVVGVDGVIVERRELILEPEESHSFLVTVSPRKDLRGWSRETVR
jgi:transglutaminase-like putative cysteine protease